MIKRWCVSFRCFWERLRGPMAVGVSAIFLIGALSDSATAEPFYKGNVLFNACQSVPVFSEPRIAGTALRVLSWGESVTVKSREAKYFAPDSDPASEQNQRNRLPDNIEDDELNPHLFTRFAWVGIGAGGFVSAGCMVKEPLFRKQDPAIAQEKIKAFSGKKAKKGFSEEEEGEVTAMKGAAGKAKRKHGRTDYQSFDDYLKAMTPLDYMKALAEFRKAGQLGEYAR
jgi:hypothetical protein